MSQSSTGSIIPYAPRERVTSSGLYAPGSDTSTALWKTRVTVSDRTLVSPAKMTLELLQGGGISETADLRLVAPIVRFRLTDKDDQEIGREALKRDIIIESIVDRFVNQENIAALVVFNYGKPNEEKWLIEPKNIFFAIADDRSRSIGFTMRDTDFVFSLAAVRPKKMPQGWQIFTPPPPDNKNLSATSDEVTDTPTQVRLTWSPAEGSRSGYRIQQSYAPFTGPACHDGREITGNEITAIRRDFPPLKSDSITVSDLLEGQKVYIQLCSTNSRTPPDISEGIVTTYTLPKRAKASLKDAPSEDTSIRTLDVTVAGESLTAYRYVLIAGGTTCDGASYSQWLPLSSHIQSNLSEGPYALCVLGKISDDNIQNVPTALLFRVDQTPPATFSLTSPNQTLTARKPEITWTSVNGANSYVISVTTDTQCSVVVKSVVSTSPKLSNITVPDGNYYLCVTAKDAAGNTRNPSNDGVPFSVDATPPENFSITFPIASSPVYVHTPTIAWTAAAGATSYSFKVGSDASCSNPVTSGQNVNGLTQTLSHLLAGPYYLCVTASDNAGNTTQASNSGLSFEVSTGEWRPITDPGGALAARSNPLTVWAPSYGQLLVWGGVQGSSPQSTGARYDLQSNSWLSIATPNAPTGRTGATALWDNAHMRMIIWGGADGDQTLLNNGAYYEPGGSWTPTESAGAALARKGHTAVFTGSSMIVWGGIACSGSAPCGLPTLTNTGGTLNLSTNTWQSNGPDVDDPDVPTAREKHTAVWTGTAMIVWGGSDGTSELHSGGLYDPNAIDSWKSISTTDAPSPRRDHVAVWTGAKMLIWGGYGCIDPPTCSNQGYLNNGGLYDPVSNSWSPVNSSGALSPRSLVQSAWDPLGQRLFIWGGFQGASYLNDGGMVSPDSGWSLPQVNPEGSPSARAEGATVWTGNEIITFGGNNGGILWDGAIYTPP